jgi:hypothetical protein
LRYGPRNTADATGDVALAAVSRFYGVPATESEIARLAGTMPAGWNGVCAAGVSVVGLALVLYLRVKRRRMVDFTLR